MAGKDNSGIVRLILVLVLAVLILAVISGILKLAFGGLVGDIILGLALIAVVIWLLSRDGQKWIRKLLQGI